MEKTSAPPRWWDWTAIILLFILLQTAALRLVSTSWTPFLYLTQSFTTIGIIIGLALGFSRFQRQTARWISFLYMLVMLPLLWTLIIDQQVSLEDQLSSVAGRLFFSITDLIAGQPVDDPILFVAIMSIAFWIISSSAGFSLVRHQNYLAIIIPSAIGLLVIQNYDNYIAGRLWILGFFIFIALLLLGRLNYLQNRASWRQRRVFLSTENSIDLAGGMAIFAGVIILVSWAIPASFSGIDFAVKKWNEVTQPWRDFTKEMENSVSALESPSGGRPGEFFGTELSLGRGFPLSDMIMFEVKVPDLPSKDRPPRFYWRGRIYDYFLNEEWYTTGSVREEFSPLTGNLSVADEKDFTPQRYLFSIGESKFSLLYAPSQPVWFNRPGSILASPADKGKDIVTWNANPMLMPGETYQADSIVKNPNLKELREAGMEYPEWVKSKYLQLPDNFSPRIKTLAEEITANSETPYDKADAVTRYLRENIKYSATIPPPPRNTDTLEWILFDYKQGFCVYYATSEILMLRSLGIPARMAAGFAQGTSSVEERGVAPEEDLLNTSFIVRKKNAHAWPEVYFPGIGWVEFEPTGNQTPLNRPAAPGPENNDSSGLITGNIINPDDQRALREEDRQGIQNQPVLPVDKTVPPLLYLIPLFMAFASLTIFLNHRYALPARIPVFIRTSIERSSAKVPAWLVNWEHWVTLSPIEKSFESINHSLRQLDSPAPIHATPAERANALTQLLPNMAIDIKVLLDEHQTSLYTSRTADVTLARRAAFKIRVQTLQARIRKIWMRIYSTHA